MPAKGTTGYVLVPLTQGQFARINPEDAERVCVHRWYAQRIGGKWYASRAATVAERRAGSPKVIYLHRYILDADSEAQVDHDDLDGLNNTRRNIRGATKSDNMANRGAQTNNSSGFKGVHWSERRHCWVAQICKDRQRRFLGHFADAADAARAYDEAARRLHGPFARTNFD